MATIDEIKTAIESLPEDVFTELREWLSEKDWGKWDQQMQQDSDSGKLDFLLEEALHEKQEGKLRDL